MCEHDCVRKRNSQRERAVGVGRESESLYLEKLYSDFVVCFQPANSGWRAGWRAIFKETEKGKAKRSTGLKGHISKEWQT